MKISPVVGTPTIPQPSSTGLSPEKIQRLKSIAAGKEPTEAPHEEKVNLAQKEPASNKVIKMQTNKTPEQPVAVQETAPIPTPDSETKPESAISDADVQTKPAPEAIQQVSPQVAAFAKQKRALQVKEREIAEREKAINDKLAKAEAFDGQLKSGSILRVLQERMAIPKEELYSMLTDELLGTQSSQPITKEEIVKVVDERFAGKDAAQEEAVFSHMQRNVDRLSGSEDYPFVKAAKAQDKVMELIKRTWKEQGDVIDEEEALALIDAELKEEAKAYAKLLKEPEPTTPAAVQPAPKPATAGIKTLTNKDSARPGSSRRQRALAAFLGQK